MSKNFKRKKIKALSTNKDFEISMPSRLTLKLENNSPTIKLSNRNLLRAKDLDNQ